MELIFSLCNNEFLTFLVFPVPTHSIYYILPLKIQVIFSGISLAAILLDLYVELIITVTLIYKFNKLTNEAQLFLKEKLSEKTGLFTKRNGVIGICNTHDTLSTPLRLSNETVQIITGYIILGSMINSCSLTYVLINNSIKTDPSYNVLLDCNSLVGSPFKQFGTCYKLST